MKTNYIKDILYNKGIASIRPTGDTLQGVLKMSYRRFMKLLDNRNAGEMTVSEREAIEFWLEDLLGEPWDILQNPNDSEEVAENHSLLSGSG